MRQLILSLFLASCLTIVLSQVGQAQAPMARPDAWDAALAKTKTTPKARTRTVRPAPSSAKPIRRYNQFNGMGFYPNYAPMGNQAGWIMGGMGYSTHGNSNGWILP